MTKLGVLRALHAAATTAATAPKAAFSERNRLIRYTIAAALFCTGIVAVCLLLHSLVHHTTGHYTRLGGHSRHRSGGGRRYAANTLDLARVPQVVLEADAEVARRRNANCSYWDCFNVYKCGHGNADRMSVYVYPLQTFVDANTATVAATTLSKEFYFILKAIVDSPYYTPDPNEACVFVPSLDLLNQNRVNGALAAKALASLEQLSDGHIFAKFIYNVLYTFGFLIAVGRTAKTICCSIWCLAWRPTSIRRWTCTPTWPWWPEPALTRGRIGRVSICRYRSSIPRWKYWKMKRIIMEKGLFSVWFFNS